MSDANKAATEPLPKSLEGHSIPQERLAAIRPLIAGLSETMLTVSAALPFQADYADFVRVLEQEGRRS